MSTNKEFELPDDLNFEKALRRLEEIVQELEGDACDLEQALHAHAEGMALARFCMDRLEAAEFRVRKFTLEERDE